MKLLKLILFILSLLFTLNNAFSQTKGESYWGQTKTYTFKSTRLTRQIMAGEKINTNVYSEKHTVELADMFFKIDNNFYKCSSWTPSKEGKHEVAESITFLEITKIKVEKNKNGKVIAVWVYYDDDFTDFTLFQ